jgi:hypothetical protein
LRRPHVEEQEAPALAADRLAIGDELLDLLDLAAVRVPLQSRKLGAEALAGGRVGLGQGSLAQGKGRKDAGEEPDREAKQRHGMREPAVMRGRSAPERAADEDEPSPGWGP